MTPGLVQQQVSNRIEMVNAPLQSLGHRRSPNTQMQPQQDSGGLALGVHIDRLDHAYLTHSGFLPAPIPAKLPQVLCTGPWALGGTPPKATAAQIVKRSGIGWVVRRRT